MAGQRLGTRGQLPTGELQPPHGRNEVVVDTALQRPAEVGGGAHVSIEEGQLVAALVEPDEVAARVHQTQQELPDLAPLARHLDRGREEVDLRFITRTVDQRNVGLRSPPTSLATVVAQRLHADRVTLLTQLPAQPRRRQPLLRRRPGQCSRRSGSDTLR